MVILMLTVSGFFSKTPHALEVLVSVGLHLSAKSLICVVIVVSSLVICVLYIDFFTPSYSSVEFNCKLTICATFYIVNRLLVFY